VNISQGKRKIVAIRKPAKKDVVRDEDYEAVAEAQAFAGLASQRARRLARELNGRLRAGAIDAANQYYFDDDLLVIRTGEALDRAAAEHRIDSPAAPTAEPTRSLRLAERTLATADIEFLRTNGFRPQQLRRFRRKRSQVHRQLMLEIDQRFRDCITFALKARKLDTAAAWQSRISVWMYIRVLLVIGLFYVLCPELSQAAAAALVRRLQMVAAELVTPMPEAEMGDAPSA
jgi:hypothetical protein